MNTYLAKLGGIPLCLTPVVAAVLLANMAGAEERTLSLEEVVVTAQKREQNALDVPITIDNFSADDIAKTGAMVVRDIADYIPGFEVRTDLGITQFPLTIRGVTSSNISVGGDPSVATFYDGVYLPQAASTVAFADMARVEVLKGPQGTLFGRNASAGVVNLVPNQPGEEDEAFLAARIGTDNLYRVEAMGNTAITDNLFIRVNALHNQKDGFADNLAGGKDPGEEDNQAARIALLWRASDSTDLQLSYDYDKVDNASRAAMGFSRFSYSMDPFDNKVENDLTDGEETRDMDAWTFKLSHAIDDSWDMKFLTSYRDWSTTNREEEDGTAESTVYTDINNEENSDIFYNEIQFRFKNQRFDWVFGANYSEEDVKQRTTLTLLADTVARLATAEVNAALGANMDHMWNADELAVALNGAGLGFICGGSCTQAFVEASGDSLYELFGEPAVFGPSYAGIPWQEYIENTGDFKNAGLYSDVDITLNDRWNLLLGVRYSRDEKDFTWFSPTTSFANVRAGVTNVAFNDDPARGIHIPNDVLIKASDDWNKVTGRAVIKYQLSDAASTYLSYSTGYKSGGFDSVNGRSIDDPFDPEDSTNYEWGIKGDFFDARLRAQLSVYRLEIDGRQESVDELAPGQVVATPRIINGDQSFDGVEVTVDWLARENLRLGLVTTYRDEESDFELYYNSIGELIDEQQSGSTDLAYTLGLDWTPAISVGSLLVHADYIFKEDSLRESENFDPAYMAIDNYGADQKFLNARVVWFSDDSHYEFGVWGKNLLDNQYATEPGGRTKEAFGTVYTTVNAPLTWGVDLKYNF